MCCENLLWPAGWEKCWIPRCVWHSHLSLSRHEKSESSSKDRHVFSRNKGTNIVSKEVAKTVLVTADLDQASKPLGEGRGFPVQGQFCRISVSVFSFKYSFIEFTEILMPLFKLNCIYLSIPLTSWKFLEVKSCFLWAYGEMFSTLLKDNANLNFHQTSFSMCCTFISLPTNLLGYVCCIIFPRGGTWGPDNPDLTFSEEHKGIRSTISLWKILQIGLGQKTFEKSLLQ